MFEDDILEKLLRRADVRRVPIYFRSVMIKAIYEVLKENGCLKGEMK